MNPQSIRYTPEADRSAHQSWLQAVVRAPRIALETAASLVAGTTLITDPNLQVLGNENDAAAFAQYVGVSGDQYYFKHCRNKQHFDALVAESSNQSGASSVLSRSFFGDDENELLIKLRKITSDGEVLIFISLINVSAFRKFDDILLRELFGLTAAESRVATYLYNGISLKEIAERNNASVATVRDQLSSIFQKTRTNSQPKLVSLLGRLELMLA